MLSLMIIPSAVKQQKLNNSNSNHNMDKGVVAWRLTLSAVKSSSFGKYAAVPISNVFQFPYLCHNHVYDERFSHFPHCHPI